VIILHVQVLLVVPRLFRYISVQFSSGSFIDAIYICDDRRLAVTVLSVKIVLTHYIAIFHLRADVIYEARCSSILFRVACIGFIGAENCYSVVYLSVCWSRPWALQKRLNWSRCQETMC